MGELREQIIFAISFSLTVRPLASIYNTPIIYHVSLTNVTLSLHIITSTFIRSVRIKYYGFLCICLLGYYMIC
jgi:hypothetical protein